MFGPTSIGNLLAAIPKPPWTQPLNWNLHMTQKMEERIPFHFYTQPDAAQTSFPTHITSFSQFSNLPAEIQLRILTFCSAPTLFQIMRVSSMLRIEAAKLFWASPNTYYYIEFEWLLKGGYPGDTLYDLHFLAHVQNVEVDYALGSDSKISSPQNPVTSIQQNLIRGFWKTLKNRFPNVRRVVINKTWMSVVLGDIEAMPPCLRFLLESCPSDIDISAFVLEEKNSLIKNRTEAPFAYEYQRSLYRPTSDVERPFCWNRETILMPMKSSRGPVGEFERLFYENDRVLLQKNALGPLAVEALDRYHFDEGRLEPFPCPSPRCVIHFEKAGQWTIHAVETHSSAEFYYWMGLNIIPESLQGIFDRHMNDTERKGKELFKRFRSLYDAWNEEGGEKRREMENGWIDQLENDEAWNTGQDAKENERFQYFTMLMEQEVDGVNKGDPNLNR